MSSDRSHSAPAVATPSAVAVSPAGAPQSGRLAVLSVYAAAASVVPIPFLPDRLITQVRGAIAQDVVSRHGLSLTSDARSVLSAPSSEQGVRALVRKATLLVTRRLFSRLSPLGAANATLRGLEVFALGHLLDRYMRSVRRAGAVRVHAEEARRVRTVIDRAIVRAVSPALQPTEISIPAGVEDLRDEFTRWVDALLLTGAALPGYVERRLEAAFDEIVESTPDLRDE